MKEVDENIFNIEHNRKPCLSTWSNIHHCRPSYLFFPKNEDEIRCLFDWCQKNGKKVRIVGGLCMENNIWCPDKQQEENKTIFISNSKFNKILNVDDENQIIDVQSGILIKDLNEELACEKYKLALPTQGAQNTVSLIGAISTCTKGTGITYQCLSSYVKQFSIIFPNGTSKIVNKEEDEDLFNNILCGMGSFGMITSIQIQCVPLKQLKETTESTTITNIISNFSQIVNSAERVRIWWIPLDGRACISRISSTTMRENQSKEHSWFRRRLIGYYFHQFLLYLCIWFPFLTVYAVRLLYSLTKNVPQLRIGTQKDLLPMDCLYSQRTSEWSIPIEYATDLLNELNQFFSNNKPSEMNGMIEIRFVKSDHFPLSPAFNPLENKLFVDVGLVQYCPFRTTEPYLPFKHILTQFCTICQKLNGRFHWAKEISSNINNRDYIQQIWGKQFNNIHQWINTRNRIDPQQILWTNKFYNLFNNN